MFAIKSNRFQVRVVCAPATSSGNSRFRRPVHVRVMDTTKSEWHAVRGLNDGCRAEISNVDSRYSGPRSAHGQALARCREIAEELNAAEVEAMNLAVLLSLESAGL